MKTVLAAFFASALLMALPTSAGTSPMPPPGTSTKPPMPSPKPFPHPPHCGRCSF